MRLDGLPLRQISSSREPEGPESRRYKISCRTSGANGLECSRRVQQAKQPNDGFQKLDIRVEDRYPRLRTQLRQRVAALDHLVQFREVDLNTNGEERMRFACVHDPGSGRHIDGSKKILSRPVLEMRFAKLNAFGPLNHHRHAWELRCHKRQAPPSEPHQMHAGHDRHGEAILLAMADQDRPGLPPE